VHSEFKSIIGNVTSYEDIEVFVNRQSRHDSLVDAVVFISDTARITLYNGLMMNSFSIREYHNKNLIPPYDALKKGKIKWTSASHIFFRKGEVLKMAGDGPKDTLSWELNETGDSAYLTYYYYIPNSVKLSAPEPDTILVTRKFAVSLRDSLIGYVEEVLHMPTSPQILKQWFSDFQVIPQEYFNALCYDGMESLSQTSAPEISAQTHKEERKDLATAFHSKLKLTDSNLQTKPIYKLPGRYQLLVFWFTGCAPCIREMNYLNSIQDQLKASKINTTGIHYYFGNADKLKKYKDLFHLTFDLYYTQASEDLGFMKGYGAPVTLLYDKKKRKVLSYIHGYNPKSFEDELEQMIQLVQVKN